MIVNDKEKAEVWNKFFSSVFTRESTENVPVLLERQFAYVLDNILVSPEKVE